MSRKPTLEGGLFSDEEIAAFSFLEINPIDDQYGGVLPEAELMEKMMDRSEEALDIRKTFFAQAVDEGVISQAEFDSLPELFGGKAEETSVEAIGNADSLAQKALEGGSESIQALWKYFESQNEEVGKHNWVVTKLLTLASLKKGKH